MMALFETTDGDDDKNQNVTNTTTVNPWAPQGEALQDIYGEAQGLFNNAYQQGPVPFSQDSMQALGQMRSIANQGNPLLGGALSSVGGVTGGAFDTNPNMFGQIYNQSYGPGSLSQGMFGDIASGNMLRRSAAPGFPVGPGQPLMEGQAGGPPSGQEPPPYQAEHNNPYFAAARDDAMRSAGDQIRASMSQKGRYGSDAFGAEMSRGLGGVAANMGLQAYESDMGRMMEAAQARSGENLARQGMGLQAAQGVQGALAQNAGLRLQGAAMSPAMNDYRYADAQKLAGVGAATEQKQQENQQYYQDILQQYKGVVGDVPGAAGTQQTAQPKQSWLQTLLGGALGGLGGLAGLFG